MIDFMVISLPRSGSTWAANWLMTDKVHCIHDPLYRMHYTELDDVKVSAKKLGIACTGLWRWPEWVNNHPAKKIILRRNFSDIQKSMREIGLPALNPEDEAAIEKIAGVHANYKDLFDPYTAKAIWEFLTETPFNAERHRELIDIEMQPNFIGLQINPKATQRLIAEIHNAMIGE